MPSRELTEILALVPRRLRRPGGRLPGGAGDAGAVPRAPGAGARHGDRGGSSAGCAAPGTRTTASPDCDRVVFHCHGGGLVSCPLDDYHFYGAMLAEQLEARVVMADYRLAPEHPFPAAHRDCARRLPGAAGRRRRPGAAGGQRGLVRWPARAGRAPRQRATKGWRCRRASSRSRAGSTSRWPPPSSDDGDAATRSSPRRGSATAGGTTRRGGLAARRPAPLAGLRRPGGPAPALPPGRAARHAAGGDRGAGAGGLEAGVAVTAESWPGMVHGWQGLVTAGVPEAAAAFARIRAYLDDLGV